MGKEMTIINKELDFLYTIEYNQQLIKRAEFVSYRISYIVLRGHWCNIIVLNVHTK